MSRTDVTEDRREVFVGRLFEATLGSLELACAYLGDRLGYYRAIAEAGAATAAELALTTETAERYAREWLEQQAAAGYIVVDDPSAAPADRRYSIPPGHDEVLLDRSSLNYMLPGALLAVAMTNALPAVIAAYRSGAGVAFADYGADLRDGQAGFNRPLFEQLLGGTYLPAVAAIHDRLAGADPGRVLDVGCGAAWSSIAIARAYPGVVVDALDADPASVELARENVRDAGMESQVIPVLGDGVQLDTSTRYGLVTIFEALHDMADPVGVLASLRCVLAPGGCVLVMDERVADTFSAPGDEVERFMYGCSVLHCLPVGMAEQPSAATGTVMRADTVRRYAGEAGYDVEVLPLEHDFFRFYRLVPRPADARVTDVNDETKGTAP
jgi:SAM-dependent methyltransferase